MTNNEIKFRRARKKYELTEALVEDALFANFLDEAQRWKYQLSIARDKMIHAARRLNPREREVCGLSTWGVAE